MGLFDRVRQALAGIPERVESEVRYEPEPEPLEVPEITAEALMAQMAKSQATRLVDIRPSHIFKMAHIAGAENIPLHQIPANLDRLEKDGAIVFYCDHGYTSLDAAGFLMQRGYTDVKSLAGGITTWQSEGGEIDIGNANATA